MAATKTTVIDEQKLEYIIGEFSYFGNSYRHIARQIRVNSLSNNLKEMSVALKNGMSDDSESLYKLLILYSDLKGMHGAKISDIYTALINDVKNYNANRSAERGFTYSANIFRGIMSGVNDIIHNINHQIDIIRSTYGIEDSHDDRFNKTTPAAVFNESYGDSMYCSEEENKKMNLAKNLTQDNGKLICKQLNSFKSDVLNTFSKTFGDRSVFEELKFSDLIIK